MIVFGLLVWIMAAVYLQLARLAYMHRDVWPTKRTAASLLAGLILVLIHVGGVAPTVIARYRRGLPGEATISVIFGYVAWAPVIWLLLSFLCIRHIMKRRRNRSGQA